MSPHVGHNGYLLVTQKRGNKRSKHQVHRLVARAFVPGEEPGLTVNHINGSKLHNLSSNLEWITRAANTRHQWQSGLVDLRGERQPSAKLSAAKVEAIRVKRRNGVHVSVLAEQYGVSISTVYKVAAGIRWAAFAPVQ